MSMLLPYGDDDGQKVEETRSSATLSSSTDTEPTQTTPLSLKVYRWQQAGQAAIKLNVAPAY
ncbi:hypothetical protein Ptr902_08066 [Pyrenophora tritici-repentis]|nr:hypothetical protein Ptr902_08066 [Pyrenophora tritici-repentis]